LFIIWLFVAVFIQQGAIRAAEITDGSITLSKVSPAFIDALEAARDRRRSRDDWDDADEEPHRERIRKPHRRDHDEPRHYDDDSLREGFRR
jgi:hypothetical protein